MDTLAPLQIDNEPTGWACDVEDFDLLKSFPEGTGLPSDLVADWPDEIKRPSEYLRTEHQRSMGRCNGEAWTALCEIAYHNATGDVIQLSPTAAYYGIQKLDGLAGQDRGSTVSGGMKYCRDTGICTLDEFPDDSRYRWRMPPADDQHRLNSFRRMRTYEDCLQWLDFGLGGIVFGIRWGGLDSVVRSYLPSGGGHAVVVHEPSKEFKDGSNPFLMGLNSWGPRWGSYGGHFHWSPKAVDQMLRSRYTVAIAASDMFQVGPRKWDWLNKGW